MMNLMSLYFVSTPFHSRLVAARVMSKSNSTTGPPIPGGILQHVGVVGCMKTIAFRRLSSSCKGVKNGSPGHLSLMLLYICDAVGLQRVESVFDFFQARGDVGHRQSDEQAKSARIGLNHLRAVVIALPYERDCLWRPVVELICTPGLRT